MNRSAVVLLLWSCAGVLQAQPVARFAPLPWPEPNAMRTATGAPGPAYWQQRADYWIQATLDTVRHRLEGRQRIRYTNYAPEPLEHLWLQLDQNLFRSGSRGARLNPEGRWSGAFSEGGFEIRSVVLSQEGRRQAARYAIEDTRMRIELDRPVPARGGVIDIELEWAFTIPEYGADRMGRTRFRKGWLYAIAQWYPRMCVYDDIRGWNALPYLGQGEFYLSYGDFYVELTVPRELIVVATGELLNPEEVLTAQQRERLQRARRSAQPVMIVSRAEAGRPDARPPGRSPLTWRFRAQNVRDFAWAASRAFLWDAASWEDVLLMSVYPEEGLGPDSLGQPGWERSTEYLRHTIRFYSETYYRYPYPVAINVAGPVGGMEYPMIVFCGVFARGQALFGVTDHEFGHTWFPMIVGSDERRHVWMDEGLNTFINHYSNLAYYGQQARRLAQLHPDTVAKRMQEPWHRYPIVTAPDLLPTRALGFLGYRKPAFGLLLLREYIVGPERFDRAFRAYIARWAFKHPQPVDFFRTLEDVAGEDLAWFWRGWFYTAELFDQAIDSVRAEPGLTRVYLSNRQGLVLPTTLELEFADGSRERIRLPVEIWAHQDRYSYALRDPRAVRRARIDPDGQLPDIDRSNDLWPRASR
ncbi:MAG: M1 family metallopeptidase [Bacteroidetes bacterium]|nr:M1 family metallopeptidase [Bacteroidota bacterium]